AIVGAYVLGRGFSPPIGNLPTALYFAIETMSTVGFGDIVPSSLDARLFTKWHAGQLARLRGVKVRFAMDGRSQVGPVSDAVARARAAGLRDFGVYVLIGFKDAPEEARDRLEFVRSLGIRPTPMRYQPLDAEAKDGHVAEGWTERELAKTMRYYSKLRWLEHVPFEEYVHSGPEGQGELGFAE
ncbi:MAG: hypothetical protein JRN42_08815, partial [Nitrososphaerota archaeon]|nr:hypothetical protein [Nitrososphaerota archaeon]